MPEETVAWRAGVDTRLHVSVATGGAQLCVMEQWSQPGAGAPTHTHFEVEEVILVVAGEAEFWCDGETRLLGGGEAILLPPQSRHGFRNRGEGVLHTVAAFGAAAPPVEYENEPGVVYEIGGTGERRRDAHRTVKGRARG